MWASRCASAGSICSRATPCVDEVDLRRLRPDLDLRLRRRSMEAVEQGSVWVTVQPHRHSDSVTVVEGKGLIDSNLCS